MAKTYSCVLIGVDVHLVEIETVIGSGFSGLNILGLPTDVTRDLRERVRSAMESIGIGVPARRVVVNVTSNEQLKFSRTPLSLLDFPVAVSIIRALFAEKEELIFSRPYFELLAGELSLSGKLKPIENSLIYESIFFLKAPKPTFCLPAGTPSNLNPVFCYQSLSHWFELNKQGESIPNPSPYEHKIIEETTSSSEKILLKQGEISKKQFEEALQDIIILLKNPKLCIALLVASAGTHNLLVMGEPGVGKSYAIKNLPSFLLPLSEKQKIEVKLIHGKAHITHKPFRAPHHSCTSAALVGGASLKPGEVTLAHHGILFLDELPEFSRISLESLREPLDAGYVTLSRANGQMTYPAEFQLCATANPCPCGFRFSRKKPCRCHTREARKYMQKMSGPLLDRFCLQIWVEPFYLEHTSDIFAQHLLHEKNQNTLDEFLLNFFSVQMEFCGQAKQQIQTEHSNQFSLRGKEKIAQISYTFAKLFPSLKEHPEFVESIHSYRTLGDLFGRML